MKPDAAGWMLLLGYAAWLFASIAIALILALLVGSIVSLFGVDARSAGHQRVVEVAGVSARQSPMHQEMVKAGTLPALEDRLPVVAGTCVDVPAGDSAYLYLVGKIPNAPSGSCSSDRDNTVSDVRWGCDAQSPAGDINATSFGASPGCWSR